MGLYLNPDNRYFAEIASSGEYIDKSGLLSYLNGRIGRPRPYIASSRPRRFGKSMAVSMIAAYYAKGCNSEAIFSTLEVSRDLSFEKHLNQYDVISLDIQEMRSIALQKGISGTDLLTYIQKEVVGELSAQYPGYADASQPVIAEALLKQHMMITDMEQL